ncbi:hypothetical protein BOW51_09570 [Solemya velesiana gill symbiont]|uniref:Uncharacterized protein n=1 Tax=Solemya velesiana gill symbiont TaxID=1918948 RepID=A0A1T2KSV5_9GAMM|nr:hypothetical protein BOW51_09570 [Solemya velesiana gill symbiont]
MSPLSSLHRGYSCQLQNIDLIWVTLKQLLTNPKGSLQVSLPIERLGLAELIGTCRPPSQTGIWSAP